MRALTKHVRSEPRKELSPWRPDERWDPFREMERDLAVMWNRMNHLFGPWPMESEGEGVAAAVWTPRVDITEDEKEYLIKAELPEVKKDEVKVLVREGRLTLSGERKAEKEEKGRKYHRLERTFGAFERSFTLPVDADPAKITSSFKDGVLNVRLPKVPGAAPKTIEVKVE